jgi:hypothetical protein
MQHCTIRMMGMNSSGDPIVEIEDHRCVFPLFTAGGEHRRLNPRLWWFICVVVSVKQPLRYLGE